MGQAVGLGTCPKKAQKGLFRCLTGQIGRFQPVRAKCVCRDQAGARWSRFSASNDATSPSRSVLKSAGRTDDGSRNAENKRMVRILSGHGKHRTTHAMGEKTDRGQSDAPNQRPPLHAAGAGAPDLAQRASKSMPVGIAFQRFAKCKWHDSRAFDPMISDQCQFRLREFSKNHQQSRHYST